MSTNMRARSAVPRTSWRRLWTTSQRMVPSGVDLNEEPARGASVDTDRRDRFGFVGLLRIRVRVGVSDEPQSHAPVCIAVAKFGAQSPQLLARLDDVGREIKVRMLLSRVVAGGLAGLGVHNPRGAVPSIAKGSANASCRPPDDLPDRPVLSADPLALQAVEHLIQRHCGSLAAGVPCTGHTGCAACAVAGSRQTKSGRSWAPSK